jgi:type III secretion system low calcium response chaperone LcrH/SycD
MPSSLRELIQESIDKKGSKFNPAQKKMIEEAIVQLYTEDNKMPKDVQGYTPKMMETIYNYGYRLFQSGKYRQALDFFKFLFRKDFSSYRYCFQIAACYHYLKDYNNACAYYRIAGDLAPHHPVPHFHLADCWIHLGLPRSALLAFKEAIRLTGNTPQYKKLKERAILEYDNLEKELKTKQK